MFTEEQLSIIKSLNVDFASNTVGWNKDLRWGFESGQIYALLKFEVRDVDGDWGWARTINNNISFDELIETIKDPYSKFDTRSWN